MELQILSENFRGIVLKHINDEWGGLIIVTKGNIINTNDLPGFVMVDNNHLAGAVLYQIKDNECEIVVIFSFIESKGVGTKLIDSVIDVAKKEKCKRVWLITTNDNTQAIRYYQKRGFSLKAVHINAFEVTKKIKGELEGVLGIDNIPILHEFEFEIIL